MRMLSVRLYVAVLLNEALHAHAVCTAAAHFSIIRLSPGNDMYLYHKQPALLDVTVVKWTS